MNRQSPAHRCLSGPKQSVAGMPAILRGEKNHSTWLVDFSPLRRWLVRGGQASAWLEQHAIDSPEACFRVSDLGEDGFVVRTGVAEYFLHDGPGECLHGRLGELPGGLIQGTRVVARDDLEVVLGGEYAADLMCEFCALDLGAVENDFLLTRVAGIAAWLRVEAVGEQRYYRIGCDPSYGEYLFETLLDAVHECGGGLWGHEDFYELRGNQHDAS
ncbi:MAG: hypothetical protein P8047_15200 [Gammaproteobacteria bacterium]